MGRQRGITGPKGVEGPKGANLTLTPEMKQWIKDARPHPKPSLIKRILERIR